MISAEPLPRTRRRLGVRSARLVDRPRGTPGRHAHLGSRESWPRFFLVMFIALAPASVLAPVAQGVQAGAAGPDYRRWAILASVPVEQTGLVDLLTAELSEQEDLKLIERQELQAITTELELAATLAPQAAGRRWKLGRLIGADALILLSWEEARGEPAAAAPQRSSGTEKKRFVKLVISDCHYGARLALEYLPYEPDRLEELAARSKEVVHRTRQRFARGIRQVIAVTHFVSKDLTHKYDQYQAGFAYLMANALTACPGVAVVETEEARAIAGELALRAAEVKQRLMPLFVEGEYQIWVAKPGATPTVRLTARASDGKQVRLAIHEQDLSLGQVTQLLTQRLPSQLVRLARQSAPSALDGAAQHALLAARAQVFSQLGAYEHSTGLEEAALLLQPDDAPTRLAAIGDYLRWIAERLHAAYLERISRSPTPRSGDSPSVRADAEEALRQWRLRQLNIAVWHLEYLLRRRSLNPREADTVASTVLLQFQPVLASTREARELWPQIHAAKRDCLWRLYPLFAKLDPELADGTVRPIIGRVDRGARGRDRCSPTEQYESWTRRACRQIFEPLAFSRPSAPLPDASTQRQVFDDFLRFVTEVAPEVPLIGLGELMTRPRAPSIPASIMDGRIALSEVERFYGRLEQTGLPGHAWQARLGRLALRMYGLAEPISQQEALGKLDALAAEVDAWQTDDALWRSAARHFGYHIRWLKKETTQRPREANQPKRHPLPPDPIPETKAALQVRFEPTDLPRVEWFGLRRCDQTLDVAWDDTTVWVLEGPSKTRAIFHGEKSGVSWKDLDAVLMPAWDGQNFWIACRYSGIHVVSPDGAVVAHVGTGEGLPPYSPGGTAGSSFYSLSSMSAELALHAIEPGRCVAIGRYGPRQRVWFAVVTLAKASGGAQPEVRLFHTATHLPEGGVWRPADDPRQTFRPAWLAEYKPPHGRRLLLVGRAHMAGDWSTRSRPLAVDLETLAVSVFPVRLPMPFSGQWLCDGGEQAVIPGRHGPQIISLVQQGLEQPAILRSEPDLDPTPKWRPFLLRYDNAVYQTGNPWHRVDLRTCRVEKVKSTGVPYEELFERYAVSAHYGLVAWNRGSRPYRVVIEPAPRDPFDRRYTFVPSPNRTGHRQAVQALQALGASVDTRWGYCRHATDRKTGRPSDPEQYQWRTIVYLPKTWQGGDAGLKHLRDLYNLRELHLVQAAVTDEGLRTIGQIRSLESLYVVETEATSAGLVHLRNLDRLVFLRLEGRRNGPHFNPAGLKSLGPLPNLRRITLYGPGFTTETFAVLDQFSELRTVNLIDVNIPVPQVERFQKGKRLQLKLWRPELARFLFD